MYSVLYAVLRCTRPENRAGGPVQGAGAGRGGEGGCVRGF